MDLTIDTLFIFHVSISLILITPDRVPFCPYVTRLDYTDEKCVWRYRIGQDRTGHTVLDMIK